MRTVLFIEKPKSRVRETLKVKASPQETVWRGTHKFRLPRNGRGVRGTLDFSHPRSAGKTLYINI